MSRHAAPDDVDPGHPATPPPIDDNPADDNPAGDSVTGGAVVAVRGLTRTYRTGDITLRAVDDIDLDIAPGSFTALTGPSGSGKSTLLQLLGAIDRPDTGTITVDTFDITTLPRRQLSAYRRTVGFVFQGFNLLPALTALDNVLAPTLPGRHDRAETTKRAHDLLDAVGLTGRHDALPSQLSGGQQQRVAIARALITRPRLLLADEPTGNLDTTTGQEILDLIARLRDQHPMTVVLATHDRDIAATADRNIRVIDGQLAPERPVTSQPRRRPNPSATP